MFLIMFNLLFVNWFIKCIFIFIEYDVVSVRKFFKDMVEIRWEFDILEFFG